MQYGLYRGCIGFRVMSATITENQTEENMENPLEAGIYWGLLREVI